MTVSQSAFADNAANEVEVTSYAIGLLDTKAQAVDIYEGGSLPMDSSTSSKIRNVYVPDGPTLYLRVKAY